MSQNSITALQITADPAAFGLRLAAITRHYNFTLAYFRDPAVRARREVIIRERAAAVEANYAAMSASTDPGEASDLRHEIETDVAALKALGW